MAGSNTLPQTTYPINERNVSGVVKLEQNDCIVNCKTLAGAVTINLLKIPSTSWSQSWKLYIIDIDNNAGTNNITINAPVGYTIDGSTFAKITSNGGSCTVTIQSTTGFASNLNTAKSKVYKANLTYVSPTVITANDLQNNIGTFTISVIDPNSFNLVCTGAFPNADKIFAMSGKPQNASGTPLYFSWVDANTLYCYTSGGISYLNKTSINIEVYY
jgi:hypothetical protein